MQNYGISDSNGECISTFDIYLTLQMALKFFDNDFVLRKVRKSVSRVRQVFNYIVVVHLILIIDMAIVLPRII